MPNDIKIHIGGDQLTRERFGYATMLRLGNHDPKDRFAHLGSITFEFFHLGINYLEKIIFDSLWNSKGAIELGTMKCEKERIFINSVDPDVMKAYDADKDFVVSYTNAYIVEACLDFFGMEARNDTPKKNVPPHFEDKDAEKKWVYEVLTKMVNMYVFLAWNRVEEDIVLQSVDDTEEFVMVTLADGRNIQIPIGKSKVEHHKQKSPDKIKDYAHYVLETGMVFKYFLSLMKCPDRDRILALFKMMMMQLKARSNNAKYPLEILRMLIQQYSLLSVQKANQVLYGCFVNTKGKPDTHIPADLQNEWIIKEEKKQVKHMFSNKTVENIQNRSSAIPGIVSIAENFDKSAQTLVRSKKHRVEDSTLDEIKIMDDLRKVRPFLHQEGREYQEFKTIPKSQLKRFDGQKFETWFYNHKENFVV